MIRVDALGLGRPRTAFALSAATTILFNTVIACAKDASHPLKMFMTSLGGNDSTIQGVGDVILFVVLGLILQETGFPERANPKRVISFLVVASLAGGVGLLAWYTFY